MIANKPRKHHFDHSESRPRGIDVTLHSFD